MLGTLSVPIYQGGAEYAAIRQAKETLGQRRLDFDSARDQVRQSVVQAWGQLDAAKANIEATSAQVQAAEIALNGVREEARVGQRTTLDVLDGAAGAGERARGAGRPRSATAWSRLIRCCPRSAGWRRKCSALTCRSMSATVHYEQVRDSWAGVRTPDGR